MPELTDHQKAMTDISYLFKKTRNDQREAKLQRAVCEFIGYQYPNVYFTSDASSLEASRNTIKNIQATKSRHAHLDLVVLRPGFGANKFHFLVIEFKKESPFLKDGTLSKEKHIQDQLRTMEILRSVGGRCEWAWTLDMSIKILTEHLGEPVRDNTPLFP